MYKIHTSQINAITKEKNIVCIYDLDGNTLLKVNVKEQNKEFLTVLDKILPNKIKA
jgi:hypothetical protein